jgi:hypothetical protein
MPQGVQGYTVDTGTTDQYNVTVHPAEARKLIKEGEKRAMRLIGTAKPL